MKPRISLAALALAARLAAAQAPVPNQYADATLRAIATAQDERQTAALLPYLTAENPRYRAAAAQAFASVQDRAAVPALLPLLADSDEAVRRATALALGQTGDSTAVSALAQALTRQPGHATRRELAEALGRCVTARSLPVLWRDFTPDTALSTSQAWGLYRAALRGLATPELLRRSAALLAARQPPAARLGAAATLARAKWTDSLLSRELAPALLKAARRDKLYAVRAACATALGKMSTTSAAAKVLQQLAKADRDHRVRIAAIRALPASKALYPASRLIAWNALHDGRASVSLTAAEWFLAHAQPAYEYERRIDFLSHIEQMAAWRSRAVALAAVLKTTNAGQAEEIVWRRYEMAPTPYEKGALLQARSEVGHVRMLTGKGNAQVVHEIDFMSSAFDTIAVETFRPNQNSIVAGYGLTALIALRRRPNFSTERTAAFAADLRRALTSGDLNQISLAAEAMADKKLYPTLATEDLTALRSAQAGLTLPRDIEAWQGIQTALDQATGITTPAPVGTARQHPIDWAVVQQIKQNQRVRIQTSRGDIVLALKVNEVPGSVASFVTLVRQHFYDGLAFHRVLPNFVAQGGDPRGDGSGSAPYTLRSEFSPLRYQEGSVGLASAGKDTESCQFFFTLQPTPHLDGRYTIFAETVSGLEVLQQLEIGDKMLKIELE